MKRKAQVLPWQGDFLNALCPPPVGTAEQMDMFRLEYAPLDPAGFATVEETVSVMWRVFIGSTDARHLFCAPDYIKANYAEVAASFSAADRTEYVALLKAEAAAKETEAIFATYERRQTFERAHGWSDHPPYEVLERMEADE